MPLDFPDSPATNATYTFGGVTWRYDGTKWGVDAVSGPSYVTSLPASPVDGQEVYYAADATNGVIWHLRYRSGSSSSYKWEFIGGTDLRTASHDEISGAVPNPSAWFNISTAISATVPLAGDYRYEARSNVSAPNTAAIYIGVATSTTGSPGTNSQGASAQDYRQLTIAGTLTGVSASAALTLRYYQTVTSGLAYRKAASLSVVPIRVG